MLGAGKDCTDIFNRYHAWVNCDQMLSKCLVGYLLEEEAPIKEEEDEDSEEIEKDGEGFEVSMEAADEKREVGSKSVGYDIEIGGKIGSTELEQKVESKESDSVLNAVDDAKLSWYREGLEDKVDYRK